MDTEIKDLITKYLLKDVNIDKIYERLNNKETFEIGTSKLHHFYNQWFEFGKDFQIDLPYWVRTDKNKNKIMIIGQDPHNDGKENSEKIKINTPYSYHKGKDNIYKKIIDRLKDNYNLYLTDLYKLFFYFKSDGEKSNKKSEYTKGNRKDRVLIHKTILNEEIKIINPKLIVTFGKPAREALEEKMNKVLCEEKKIKIVNTPHPEARKNAWVNTEIESLSDDNKVNFILNKIFEKL